MIVSILTCSPSPANSAAPLDRINNYVMRVEEGFQQTPFSSENPYLGDPILPSLLKRLLPPNVKTEIHHDLVRLGQTLTSDIRPLSALVHAATLTQYDHWGRRTDVLQTSEGWRKLQEFAIREGYVAIAYERKFREYSRIYMFAKTMIMTGDSNVIMCPMGMTDGAARTIELFGTSEMKRELLPRLASRDTSSAYISGQWMTERPGGSDVSLTETTARPAERLDSDLGPPYILDGFKWFSSAAEGNMAVALARTGEPSQGSRGLSLFVVPLRLPPYTSPLSNGVQMHRLKNKIGTHGVPTAELSLNSTRAWLIGPLNEGVKAVATVLNITRIHSAIHSIGSLQRCISIARAYAAVRTIRGGTQLLQDVPLHMASLADAHILYCGLVHMAFGAVRLLGKSECGIATQQEDAILRLLTPAIKAYAAQRATPAMEEMMGALGGLGYMEEVGIGRLIRDSVVERIWEGTVNVLSLDLIRAAKDSKTLNSYIQWAEEILSDLPEYFMRHDIHVAVETLSKAVNELPAFFQQSTINPLLPRVVLNFFASITCGLFLLQHAVWSMVNDEDTKEVDVEVFRRWVEEGDSRSSIRDIITISDNHEERARMNFKLVNGVGSFNTKL